MSEEGKVIEFPVKGHILDDKHEKLRKFFALVEEAAHEQGIIAYSITTLHAPDEESEKGCVHTDVVGMQHSCDVEWVEDTLGIMSESIDSTWHALVHKVEKNAEEHEASDATKQDEQQD
jgi:hypothetical protein